MSELQASECAKESSNAADSIGGSETSIDPLLGNKTIFFVANYLGYFIPHHSHIARAAREQGGKVFILSPDSENVSQIEDMGFTHIAIPLSRWGLNPFEDIRTVLALWRQYRAHKPDVVHHITIKPVIYGSIAARLAGTRGVVNSIFGLGYVFYSKGISALTRRLIVKILYRIALMRGDQQLIVQNEQDKAFFSQRGIVRIENINLLKGDGVDTDRFIETPQPEGEPIILLVARLQWAKGIAEFAEAATCIHRAGIKARFTIAGGFDLGSPDGLTEEDVNRLRKNSPVEFLGQCTDVELLLQRCHIVCLPSYSEGMPTSLTEAAACARAIVATDIAGCREIVRHGFNGLLVPPRDVGALSDALQTLIADVSLRKEMGINGRSIIENEGLTRKNMAKRTLDVYRKLLARTCADS